jgi:hypothetical protein
MVEGTATTTVACFAAVRLYLWENVVTPRGFSKFCNAVAISAVLHFHTWKPYRPTCISLSKEIRKINLQFT